MPPGERADPFAFFPHYLLSGFDKLGDLFDPDWPVAFPLALELDRVTFGEYIQDQGASDSWLDWFCAQEGNIRRINAAAGFAVEAVSGGNVVQGIAGGETTTCRRRSPPRSAAGSSTTARWSASRKPGNR
jgi:monoamine oxidase